MPLRDPDLQRLDRLAQLRLSRRQLRDVDRLAAGFGMSRSWFLREALAVGIPAAAAKIRELYAAGYRPAGRQSGRPRSGPRRGPQSDGQRPDRWVLSPDSPAPRPAPTDPAYEEE